MRRRQIGIYRTRYGNGCSVKETNERIEWGDEKWGEDNVVGCEFSFDGPSVRGDVGLWGGEEDGDTTTCGCNR